MRSRTSVRRKITPVRRRSWRATKVAAAAGWGEGSATWSSRLQRPLDSPVPLRLRPAPDRGLLRLQQAGQGPDRHQQRRHQLAPVHVERGRRLQGDARRRCAALLLRGPGAGRHPVHRRLEHRLRASGAVSPDRGRASGEPGLAHRRRRPAPHRDRRGRRPAPADPARHRRRPVPRDAARDAVGGLDRRGVRRRPHARLRRAESPGARFLRRRTRADCAASPRPTCCRRRAGSPTSTTTVAGGRRSRSIARA